MTADSGLAPCIGNDINKKKLLTLACCKGGRKDGTNTGIRYWIGSGKKGDIDFDCKKDDVYILGTYKNDFLYLASITKTIEMKEYYSDKRYNARFDNIYDVVNGELKRNNHLKNENIHIDEDQNKRNIAGKFVLLSNEYIYRGKDRIKFDNHLLTKLPQNREVKLYINKDAEEIVNWCLQKKDNKTHKPTDPIKRSCNQR